MKLSISLLSLTTLFPLTSANPFPSHHALPPAFFLAGDSTTAIQLLSNTSNGGGWGTGFIQQLVHGAIGTNYGHNGATTASFVSGGDWAKVLKDVKSVRGKYRAFVTIQFGHNDQKPAANLTLAQYTTNLHNLALDILSLHATPILVTSLSRRNYDANGTIIRNLEDQRRATISVARTLNINYIDLNLASTNYLNAIGKANASTYNLEPSDFTHLNAMGSVVFGNLVSWLMLTTTKLGKELKPHSRPDMRIVEGIRRGVYVAA